MEDRNSVNNASGFLTTIRIPLRHSKWLFSLVLTVHGLAVLVILFTPISLIVWPFLICLFISALWTYSVFRYSIFSAGARELILDKDDNWSVITRSNQRFSASLLPMSFVHPLLIVLLLKVEGRRLNVILLQDNLDKDILRRLRVRLRFPTKTV